MRFRILILALGTFAIGTDSFVIAGFGMPSPEILNRGSGTGSIATDWR